MGRSVEKHAYLLFNPSIPERAVSLSVSEQRIGNQESQKQHIFQKYDFVYSCPLKKDPAFTSQCCITALRNEQDH